MKKSLFTLFFVLLTVVSWAHDVEVDGIYYNLNETEKKAEVTYEVRYPYSYSASYSGSVVIPEEITYNGVSYTVTSIGIAAFMNCHLTSVTIPNSVKIICGKAFSGCGSLRTVTIPNSVKWINEEAFCDCGLISIDIPNSVKTIGYYAFKGCSNLTSVTIPNSVTSIGYGAFEGCTYLTSVTIPNSVTSIGYDAFKGCSELTSVTIGNSVTSFGKNAFGHCNNLFDVTVLSPTPPTISNEVFSLYGYLHVLPGCKEAYENAPNWRMFVIRDDARMQVDPSLDWCAKPEIAYENGSLVFTCQTAGAVCHSIIEVSDAGLHDGDAVNLNATYNISVYATLDGYNSSEIATATLVWLNASWDADAINAPEIRVAARPVLVSGDNGVVTVSGLADGESVELYTTDGKLVNTTKAFGDTATCASQPGMMIVKVGKQTVKVLVK